MIIKFNDISPDIDTSVFIADGVFISGNVKIGKNSSVWFNSVVRGDVNFIKIGENTNIQDLSMLHISGGRSPLLIGDYITIGHRCIVHGCKVNNNVLIGMGSIILDDAEIGSNSIVAAGSVVKERMKIPENVLVAGVPAKIMRDITEEEIIKIRKSAEGYSELAKKYKQDNK